MDPLEFVMDKFWKCIAVSDNRLHARQTEPAGIVKVCDLPYAADGDRLHLLDVYYPEHGGGRNPVIIDVHGGGWMYADKDLNKMYCLNLAKRGYTVFNMSYRLVPQVRVPDQLRDVMQALSWIETHMADYPCDPSRVYLTGDSAGGMLALYAAGLLADAKLRKLFGTADCTMELAGLLLTSPVAYMDGDGAMGVYTKKMWGGELKQYRNPEVILDRVTLPPAALITSSGDFLANGQTHRLGEALGKRGVPVQIKDFPKYDGKALPHVFSVLEPESNASVEAIDGALDFLNTERKVKTV